MTNKSDLVPLHLHSLMTAGPAPWTDTRLPSEVWHVARAVYGTSTEDDEKRVYRTLQAALWKLAATQPEAQPQWQPIETAPKDEAVLLYGAKRLEMCVGMNHSRDGWVTDTTSEWMSMYTPTHWMPLPAAPSAQAPQCTCPSGDGSLRWPCPVHPPSAQAEPYRCPAKRGEDPQVCGRVRCQLGRKCADEVQAEQGGE